MSSGCCAHVASENRPSPKRKILCADKICAPVISARSIETAILSSENLQVAGQAAAGTLVVGSPYAPLENADLALVVHGGAHIAPSQTSQTALHVIHGDLVLGDPGGQDTACLRTGDDSGALVMDIIHNSDSLRYVDSLPEHYVPRGDGIRYEVKHVATLIPTCPDAELMGCVETHVLPGLVMQLLWTVPLPGWSDSGYFRRGRDIDGGWGAWQQLAATVVP